MALDPLPKAKKKCSSCGNRIYVRSGPDGRRHLLAEGALAAHQQWWDDVLERRWADEANATGAKQARENLANYASLGVMVEFSTSDDAGVEIGPVLSLVTTCPACRALDGKVFDPRVAPPIPVPGCSSLICRCD